MPLRRDRIRSPKRPELDFFPAARIAWIVPRQSRTVREEGENDVGSREGRRHSLSSYRGGCAAVAPAACCPRVDSDRRDRPRCLRGRPDRAAPDRYTVALAGALQGFSVIPRVWESGRYLPLLRPDWVGRP